LQSLAVRGTMASQLIGDKHPRGVPQALEQLAQARLGGCLVAPTLQGNILDIPLLLHDMPEIGALSVGGEQHLIPVSLVAPPSTLAGQAMGT
jgi:hypothetical protein